MQALIAEPIIHGAGTSELAWQAWSGLAVIPEISVDQLACDKRVVVVAPHPDDEVLGCGGLLALLVEHAHDVVLIAVTDGEASHPGSALWPAARLKHSRAAETAAALQTLGAGDIQVVRAGFDDGSLAKEYDALLRFLMHQVHPDDVLIATWHQDGHPDHDAVGSACAAVAADTGANLLEMPIWAWHWGIPGDDRIPWQQAVKIALPASIVEKKRQAMACFHSQLSEDPTTASPAILPQHVLRRFHRPYELFFVGKPR